MKKTFIVLLAILLIFAFCCCDEKTVVDGPQPTIPYCGGPIQPEGTITVSYDTSKLSDEKIIDAFIEAYTKKYTDVTVVKDYVSGDIEARLASGEIGDVFYFNDTDLYNYAITKKALLPLNQFLDPLDIDYSLVYEDVIEACCVNGVLYMVPTEYNRIAMIYNKTAVTSAGLEAPENGWTWEEFKDYCTKLTKKEGDLYTQVGGYLNYTWEPVYMSFVEGWGDNWYNEELSRVSLSTSGICGGIEEFLNLAATGVIKPEGKADLSAYMNLTDTDYVFRTITYADLETYSKQYEARNLEWDVVSFPATPVHTVGVDFSGFGVYKYTKNSTAAAAMALFLMNPEGQFVVYSKHINSVPTNKRIAWTDAWKYDESKNMEAFLYGDKANIVITPEAVLPSNVADVIIKCMGSVFPEFFNGGDYKNALEEASNMASEKWERINNSLY